MRVFYLPVLVALVLAVSGLVFTPPSEAQRGYGMHHGGYGGGYDGSQGGGWSYCPYCGGDLRGRGGYPMGPGMMGPRYGRQGMGPDMMGPDYGRPYGYPNDRRDPRYQEPLEKEDAQKVVEDMLRQSRNPNLKPGDVEEKDRYFVVDILTNDGSLVDKMQIDKETGMMRSIY